jgi:hypothetical protein
MVSIVIVNFNTSDILGSSLSSVLHWEGKGDYEIIVVDNCSDEKNISILDKHSLTFPNVKFIRLKEQVSFSEANNIGAEGSSHKEFLIIMNPDILFTQPLLNELSKIMNDNKEIGALSPLLLGEDKNFQYSYFQRYPTIRRFIYFESIFAKLFIKSRHFNNKYLMNLDINVDSKELQFTEQIPCAFFFTSYNIFKETGMMDKSYKLFFEDVDLSYRVNQKYKLAIVPQYKVLHLSGVSFVSSDNWWMYGRFVISMINFIRIHNGVLKAFLLRQIVKLNSSVVLLGEIIKSPSKASLQYRYKKHKYLLDLLKED